MLAALIGAVLVRALLLPPHATIDPFGARALMVADRAQVAATVTVGAIAQRVVAWDARGDWRYAPEPPSERGALSTAQSVAAFESGGTLLINAKAVFDGAMLEATYRPQRLRGNVLQPLDFSSCPDPTRSAGALIAGRYADGDAVATMASPAVVDVTDVSGQLAPMAVRLRGVQCADLGAGYALATAGTYAAGYIGYVEGVPQASDVAVRQRYVALRWHGDQRQKLGPGVALAVAPNGTVVGASSLPNAAFGSTPHARVWQPDGSTVDILPRYPLSVAYAVDPGGRVAGMCEDAQHRHYAFLWTHGHTEILDDVVGRKAAGWRFEAIYAFTPDGGLIGIGTFHGVATAFEIRGLLSP